MAPLSRVRRFRSRLVQLAGVTLLARVWPNVPPDRITLIATFFTVAVNFAINAVLLWIALLIVAPGLVGSSAEGISSLAQAIPATIVALFVFTLGAIVGIAQLSISTYGHRAALMLVEDHAVAISVIRPLILAIAALLLAGQIPESGDPSTVVTSAFAALAILTVIVILQSVGLLGGTFLRYTAPLTFSEMVVRDVEGHLRAGVVQMVRWKVPMLEEMGKLAVRRGDSAAFGAALQGLGGVVHAYASASETRKEARGMPFEDATPPYTYYAWLGEDLRETLVRMGEDTLRQSAPSEDSDHVVERMHQAGQIFLHHHLYPEAKRMVQGLAMLGCTTHQVGSGYVNQMVRPAAVLARLVRQAAVDGSPHISAYALAAWILAVSYTDEHFGTPEQPLGRHPNWGPGFLDMGDDPPWDSAAQVIMSDDWQRKWSNQMNYGVDFVLLMLGFASQAHDIVMNGGELPPLPSLSDIAEEHTSE